MKKNIKLVLTIVAICAATATQAQKGILTGRIIQDDDTPQTIKLSRANGYSDKIALASDGTFKISLDTLAPGLYRLEKIGELYLAPDYQLQVKVAKNGKPTFKGRGATENKKLYSTRSSFSKYIPSSGSELVYRAYAMDVPQFLAQLDRYHHFAIQQQKNTKDSHFASTLLKEAEFTAAGALRNYKLYYGTDSVKLGKFYTYLDTADRAVSGAFDRIDSAYKAAHPKSFTSSEKTLVDSLIFANVKLDDEQSFDQSYAYRSLIDNWISNKVYTDRNFGKKGFDNMQIAQIQVADTYLTNPVIGSYYRYQFTSNYFKLVKEDSEADSLYNNFMSNPANAAHYPKMKAIYDKRMAVRKGKISPDFDFENIDGARSKLSDLRGKYVYIDVWATWCGPCKMQIPHLIKLEKELHDKNITFVSLSLDDQKDKQKWKDYVHEKQLGGVQVISDNAFDTHFVQQYNINAIPRFILLDPHGQIVSPNADRPSDAQLREQLLRLLE